MFKLETWVLLGLVGCGILLTFKVLMWLIPFIVLGAAGYLLYNCVRRL